MRIKQNIGETNQKSLTIEESLYLMREKVRRIYNTDDYEVYKKLYEVRLKYYNLIRKL